LPVLRTVRLLKLWKRRELSDKAPRRAQKKEKKKEQIGRYVLAVSSPTAKGTCKAADCEVRSRESDKETDCIMERRLVELRQPGFQGWACSECGHVFIMVDCVLTGLTLEEIIRHF
jgi:hypothetical protein